MQENQTSDKNSCNPDTSAISAKDTIKAMSTPLASIFGSGFLVVVPILASAVGPYAILAMIIVAFVAFLVGKIVPTTYSVLNLFWQIRVNN